MTSLCDYLREGGRLSKQSQSTPTPRCHGQSAVEFALVATVAMIVLFVGAQFAMIGRTALALGQMTYQGARYAAVHPDCGDTACTITNPTIRQFMLNVGWSTFNNNSANLVVTVSPDIPPSHTFGQAVTV